MITEVNQMRELFLICGGNGAGKTTFFSQFLQNTGIEFVNADEIAKAITEGREEDRIRVAFEIAAQQVEDKLFRGESFAYETVFSHPSRLDLINRAKEKDFKVSVIFIVLSSPNLHIARVKLGHMKGQRHDVPESKITNRIPRLLTYIPQALVRADEALVMDNSSAANPFLVVARFTNGVANASWPIPEWLQLALDASQQ